MSIYRQIAEQIANCEYPSDERSDDEAKSRSGIPVWDFPHIIDCCGNHEINCYPSESKGSCQKEAVFISLSGRLRGRGRHLSFEKALHEIIHHFNDRCSQQTRSFGLITDEWNAKLFDEWRPHIENIANSGVSVEAYLIAHQMVSVIKWP